MTLAFIVRAEFDGRRWMLTVQDLATGERRRFDSFVACAEGLRTSAETHLPAQPRGRTLPRDPDGTERS